MGRWLLLVGLLACNKRPPANEPDAEPVAVVVDRAARPEPKPPPTGTPAQPPVALHEEVQDAGPATLPLYVREIRTVMVDGVEETWVLRWRGKPSLACIGKDDWWTCPCAGFAYGERGNLELARMRPDEPEETVDLVIKGGDDTPTLQHWIPAENDPTDKALPLSEIKRRPVFAAMEIADYDHDGRATELAFRFIYHGVCGHNSSVRLVGITRKHPHLHVFGPDLRRTEWEKVRLMDVPGSLEVVDIPCGDHGATEQESRTVTLDAAGKFSEQKRVRGCP